MKKLIVLLCILVTSGISIAEEDSWESVKTNLKKIPWNLQYEVGMPLETSDYIISAEPYISRVVSPCSDSDVEALYKMANSTFLLWIDQNQLSSKAAIAGCMASLQATRCEISAIESGQVLNYAYSQDRTCLSDFVHSEENVSKPFTQIELDTLIKLEHQLVAAIEERCDISIANEKNIWRNCSGVRRVESLLEQPSVIREINALPAVTRGKLDDNGHLQSSRYYVARGLLDYARDTTAPLNHNDVRYAFELYNTLPYDEEMCHQEDEHTICNGKKAFINNLYLLINQPDLEEFSRKEFPADFDFSQLEGINLLFARMLEAGMIDKPDQPPSVKFAKYPPPLVPNWSEYFEKDRYTAETGIVPPEPVAEPYAKVVKEQPKAESKPEPAKESKEVVAESGMDQDKQILIAIVAGAVVLLLLGFYALRRRKK